jgi:hypothetical protein
MVFVEATDPRSIVIEDIAHSLALTCRFNGHTREFYSVAQHSVLVSHLLESDRHPCPELALLGLLHDATEAYVGDMVRPLKLLCPQFRAFEAKIWQAIVARFGLATDTRAMEALDWADRKLLATEARDLLGPPPWPWCRLPEPAEHTITPWTAEAAEAAFLARFAALMSARAAGRSWPWMESR